MNLQLLIDSIVRQTTVLVAQLATARGARTALAHVANQVFLELADELNEQGVSRKVSAGMFGLSLRAYQRKLQRLREESERAGPQLWRDLLQTIERLGVVTRGQLLTTFVHHDSDLVRGVLHDLCDSGLIFRSGRGASVAYRVVDERELLTLASGQDEKATEHLLWALIYRAGEVSHHTLVELVRGQDIERPLAALIADGRVTKTQRSFPEHDSDASLPAVSEVYSAARFDVALDSEAGWEAAVFDHYQALVQTIITKLNAREDPALPQGGSTYSVTVWPGHPLFEEALGQLDEFRRTSSDLRKRIRSYNAEHPEPKERWVITTYGGQHVVSHEDSEP